MKRGASVDLQDFLDKTRFSPMQWVVFAICFGVILMDGFDTASIGYIAPSLGHEWHASKAMLGPVLTAALVGFAVGPLVAGTLADRLGRKKVLVGAVLLFALSSLAAAFSTDLDMLAVFRLLTGFGLGAAAPGAVALVNEYAPSKKRALLTNAMFCAFPLGAAGGGFLAAWMIPALGWRSVLVFGAVVPLLLAMAAAWQLPESARYLVTHGRPLEQIRAVLQRISPTAADFSAFSIGQGAEGNPRVGGLRVVLAQSRLLGTAMLCVAYFMGLVIFYALINWMPILLRESGITPAKATIITAMFPLGGVGAIASGWLMDRFEANRVIAATYALTAVVVYLIGQSAGNLGLLTVAVFIGGTLMNTAQSSMPALAADFYPTAGRAAGVGWMLGVGRLGGVAGSLLVGALAALHMDFGHIFLIVAVPGLIAAAALEIKRAAMPRADAQQPPAGGVRIPASS